MKIIIRCIPVHIPTLHFYHLNWSNPITSTHQEMQADEKPADWSCDQTHNVQTDG